MEKVYNKLVRDKIPEIIKNNKRVPYTKILNDDEYKKYLEKKLEEEKNEVLESSGIERIGELADLLEVIKYLAICEGKTLDDILLVAEKKNFKNGSFANKIFLEKVIEKE